MLDPSFAPDEALLRRFLLGELSGPERERVAAYLDRHPEVASTLDALNPRDTVFATRSRGAGADDSATAVTSDIAGILAPPERPGDLGQLGRYRVLRVLGRGGMGVVFEAEDNKLKRHVALKAMLPEVAASAAARERFFREARAAAAIESDNIVPIYDIVEAAVPFIAMPLLAGKPLDKRLKEGPPLSGAEVLAVGSDVAKGLAAAHAKDVIHRDIKPANIWFEETPAGTFHRARLLDFGLAREVSGADLTTTGAVQGTPSYMSPEQAKGEKVDHRTDLWSLGVVLYHMATGRKPFRGACALDIMAALATENPIPVQRLNPAAPAALSALIDRLLRKNPAERPATAQEVADELLRIAAPWSGAHPALPESLAVAALPVPRTEDVWADIATDTEPDDPPYDPEEEEEEPRPARRAGRGPLYAALGAALGAVLLVGGLYAGGVFRSGNKDRSAKQAETPPGGSPVTPAKPPAKPPAPPAPKSQLDPELRKALVWVLNSGGEVKLVGEGGPAEIVRKIEDLDGIANPRLWIELRSVTDDALDNLKAVTGCEALLLTSGRLSDAGLKKLADLPLAKTIDALTIADQRVTHAGFDELARFPRLKLLGLTLLPNVNWAEVRRLKAVPVLSHLIVFDTNLTDDHVAGLAELDLIHLVIGGNARVTDDGLAPLSVCKGLTNLDVTKTKVTKAGAEKLAAALPRCKIEYDGGVIEPKR